jgi:hypothetical protein
MSLPIGTIIDVNGNQFSVTEVITGGPTLATDSSGQLMYLTQQDSNFLLRSCIKFEDLISNSNPSYIRIVSIPNQPRLFPSETVCYPTTKFESYLVAALRIYQTTTQPQTSSTWCKELFITNAGELSRLQSLIPSIYSKIKAYGVLCNELYISKAGKLGQSPINSKIKAYGALNYSISLYSDDILTHLFTTDELEFNHHWCVNILNILRNLASTDELHQFL